MSHAELLTSHPECQMIWQSGSKFFEQQGEKIQYLTGKIGNLYAHKFLDDIEDFYRIADLVVSRAGAGTISELAVLGKPTILIPSPNVSEDHQTKNALALVNRQAALLVRDEQVADELFPLIMQTIGSEDTLRTLSENIRKLGRPDAAKEIATEILKYVRK
jgi:UDP-N-acetylglucosamine--N-acetylmuramyl-(pentapeptide) pyrophosphoryl-undecaprenol N-acetylglucosamine transferase